MGWHYHTHRFRDYGFDFYYEICLNNFRQVYLRFVLFLIFSDQSLIQYKTRIYVYETLCPDRFEPKIGVIVKMQKKKKSGGGGGGSGWM